MLPRHINIWRIFCTRCSQKKKGENHDEETVSVNHCRIDVGSLLWLYGAPATTATSVAKTEEVKKEAAPKAEAKEEPADTTPYKFAIVAPMTGNNAQFGQAYKYACQMLIDDVNNNGGINGHPVELEVFDDKNDPKEPSMLQI